MSKSVLSNIHINMYEVTKMQNARSKQDIISNIISVKEAVVTHPNQWFDIQSATHQWHILA